MAVAAGSDADVQRAQDVDHFLLWPVIAVLIALPLAVTYILWSAPGGEDDPSQSVAFGLADIALFVLVTVCIADAIETHGKNRKRWYHPAILLAATMSWFAVAFFAHPSWRGVEWFLRLAGTWAIAYAIYRVSFRRQTQFLTALVLFAALQAALGIAQYFADGAVGVPAIEWNMNWQRVGGATFGRGSFTNSYHLAALLVVAVGAALVLLHRIDQKHSRLLLHGLLCLMAIGISLTFSRTVFFALLPIVGILIVRRVNTAAVLMLVTGVAVGVLLGLQGHATKASQVTDRDSVDSGRLSHLEDASLLAASEPVVGVGPGRFVIALRDVDYSFYLAPPHNFAAQAAAEAGVLGGVLALSTLGSFGLWLLRRGTLPLITGIALVPFFVLDWFPYASPAGLVLTGLWLAVLCSALGSEPEPERKEHRNGTRRRASPVTPASIPAGSARGTAQ